jgi:uncharacterized membrane protein YbhN (UPF0104 family)
MSATEPSDRPDALARFRPWVAMAVALASLGYLLYALWTGFKDTAGELASFNWAWYPLVLALTLVNYGLRYAKWHYLLRWLGVEIPHRTNLPIFLCGLAMVISPGKAGEVVKPYLARVAAGAPFTSTVPVLFLERATDGVAVVLLSALGVQTFFPEASTLLFTVILVILASLAGLTAPGLTLGVLGWLGAVPRLRGLADRLTEAYQSTRACLAPAPLAMMLVASLVAWWAECLGYWLVFRGLGVDTDLARCTFLYAFSTVFGAPSPGGMGMADVALTEGARTLIPGLSPSAAVASSLLIRVATLWFGVVLGAFALVRIERTLQAAKEAPPPTRG